MSEKELQIKLEKILTELNEIISDTEMFKKVYGNIYSNMEVNDPFKNGFILTKEMIKEAQKYSKVDILDFVCGILEEYLY